jgi:lipoprotein-anchoring transpeptidase ErfK/SrfK
MCQRTSFVSRRAQPNILLIFCLLSSTVAQQTRRADIHLVVDKSDFKLYVFAADRLIHTYPIAVGKGAGDKQKVGDNCTPEGIFSIVKIHNSTTWVHDFKDGKGKIAGAYGDWFLRLDTGAKNTKSGKAWKGIGIHGTHDPSLIGKMVTEGCVRLRNADLLALKGMISVGTRVTIRE